MAKKKSDNYWEPHAKILSAMPRFNAAILKARRKLKIPEEGIPFDDRANWYSSLFIPNDEDTARRYGKAYMHEVMPPNKKFLDVVDKIRADFNLDARWVHPIISYLGASDRSLDAPFHLSAYAEPRFNDVRLPKNKLRVTSLSIRIEKDTSVADVVNIWDDIEKYQLYMDSEVPNKRHPIEPDTVKRYEEVMKLKPNNTYDQIAKEHPDLRFDTGEDVRNFVRRTENRFKKRSTIRNVPNLYWHND